MRSCKSGRHFWMKSSDADKCCNGWTEKLVLSNAYPDGRELTPNEVENLICLDDLGFYHIWVRVENE